MITCPKHPMMMYAAELYRCPSCAAEDESIPLEHRLRGSLGFGGSLQSKAADEIERLRANEVTQRQLLERIADRAYKAKLYRYKDPMHNGNLEFAAEQVCAFVKAAAKKEERTPGVCTCGMGPISGCWKCD